MSTMDRRVARLERIRTPEMAFVTYIGNPEPQCLWVSGKQISRRPGESWGDFKDRVQNTAPQVPFAVGNIDPSLNPQTK